VWRPKEEHLSILKLPEEGREEKGESEIMFKKKLVYGAGEEESAERAICLFLRVR